jgi:hypothetical protein
MDKLTQKQSAGYDLVKMNSEWCTTYCNNQPVETCRECAIYEAIQKLAEYEDTELTPDACKNYKLFEDELITNDITFKELLSYIDKLKHVKSCEASAEWIPIINPPTINGEYLVTRKLFGGDLCVVSCSFATNLYKIDEYDFCGRKNIKGFYDYDSESGYYELDWNDIMAYMPLPKVYESNM